MNKLAGNERPNSIISITEHNKNSSAAGTGVDQQSIDLNGYLKPSVEGLIPLQSRFKSSTISQLS